MMYSSPLHANIHEAAFSGDVRKLKRLLQDNDQLCNCRDGMKQTPLHKAAMNGCLDCVKLLIEHGSTPNSGDICECTALHFAAANGYVDIAKFLVEKAHANMTHKTNKGHTPRYMAKSHGQQKLVAFFNEMENKMDGKTWL